MSDRLERAKEVAENTYQGLYKAFSGGIPISNTHARVRSDPAYVAAVDAVKKIEIELKNKKALQS